MNLPSREEVRGWDQARVAFFLSRNKMHECAAVAVRLRINGQRLLSLSDSDLSHFSLIHRPLKSKQLPKVPARDYGDGREDGDLSDPDDDREAYEDPREDHDQSYEPPPGHRAFGATSAPVSGGEYLDSHGPCRPPRKPLHRGKDSKQLPPEPPQQESDEEDYVDPDCDDDDDDDDDDYVEPAGNPSSNPVMHCGGRAGRERPTLHTPVPERPPGPDFYEVPDKEGNSLSLPASRLGPSPATQYHALPPRPSPRGDTRRSPTATREPSEDDEYEVCYPGDRSGEEPADGPSPPKPLPRDRSPKPPRPDFKPREFECRTLPPIRMEQKFPPKAFPPNAFPPKAFPLDTKLLKIPLPQLTPPRPADRGSVPPENGSLDQDQAGSHEAEQTTRPATSRPLHSPPCQDADIEKKPWYAGACDRKTADDALCRCSRAGAFMVRKSSGQDALQPYTLVVFYKDRVYNVPIRFIAATRRYALGREKKGEEHFSSVCHIIENHQRTPLVLIDSQSNAKDATKLCFPARP
ncbi:B-cell linker protein isoform X3 [Pseudoliparis swirei]|uniref:B-cell linker protein isoform X3 n=1 Tax=Pseudoliparis swirei TaxID=2059687 RepID=UPI0024BDB9B9|nr:B-cell linker protein isoform X3 [Pseudoliparis swirei]